MDYRSDLAVPTGRASVEQINHLTEVRCFDAENRILDINHRACESSCDRGAGVHFDVYTVMPMIEGGRA
jgi:hypothetical protein